MRAELATQLEYWNGGMMGLRSKQPNDLPTFQYSIIPVFQHSSIPVFHTFQNNLFFIAAVGL